MSTSSEAVSAAQPVERRVAIICDWLVNPGGAERVLHQVLTLYPEAHLYSLIDFLEEGARRRLLGGRRAYTSFLQRLPGIRRWYRYALPLMPYAVEQWNLREYDLIISLSHAVAKGIIVHPHQQHVCYCYTPMRYLWDMKFDYFSKGILSYPPFRWIVEYWLHHLRIWDVTTSMRVNRFIAISQFIRRRIYNCYGREAGVVYPPVEVGYWSRQNPVPVSKRKDYYFTHARLVSYKNISLIVRSFSEYMKEYRLIVAGDGPERKRLQKEAGDNVEFIGNITDEELVERIRYARAYIYAAVEDFGIAPLEAQAAGTPVIAYRHGALTETIGSHPPTGLFFDQLDPVALREAVEHFEASRERYEPAACVAWASQFDTARFLQAFREQIDDECQRWK